MTDDTTTLPPVKLCAAFDCDTPVTANARGRPAIYCSPACRPSGRRDQVITVDIAHPDTSPDGRPTERVWTVTLRRGSSFVVIAADLGWPSANALARSLADLFGPQPSGARGGRPQQLMRPNPRMSVRGS